MEQKLVIKSIREGKDSKISYRSHRLNDSPTELLNLNCCNEKDNVEMESNHYDNNSSVFIQDEAENQPSLSSPAKGKEAAKE